MKLTPGFRGVVLALAAGLVLSSHSSARTPTSATALEKSPDTKWEVLRAQTIRIEEAPTAGSFRLAAPLFVPRVRLAENAFVDFFQAGDAVVVHDIAADAIAATFVATDSSGASCRSPVHHGPRSRAPAGETPTSPRSAQGAWDRQTGKLRLVSAALVRAPAASWRIHRPSTFRAARRAGHEGAGGVIDR
jgi:hypothetical protein